MTLEISRIERTIDSNQFNNLRLAQTPVFWARSDKEIRKRQPAVEVQAKILLDNKVLGFFIVGRFYTLKRARNWAMRQYLTIDYLLELTTIRVKDRGSN